MRKESELHFFQKLLKENKDKIISRLLEEVRK